MNEVLTLDNFNKIKESKNLVVTNDRIGISLFPILLYLKFFKNKCCCYSYGLIK